MTIVQFYSDRLQVQSLKLKPKEKKRKKRQKAQQSATVAQIPIAPLGLATQSYSASSGPAPTNLFSHPLTSSLSRVGLSPRPAPSR